ncbi:MAG TPA: MarP family serine protease [Candidatus Saccharimonadia bacterium]
MNALDIAIIVILLADVVRGARIGFVRQFFSFAGFWGGLFIAALFAPLASRFGSTPLEKISLILAAALVIGLTLSALGEYIAKYLSQLVKRFKIHPLDASLGAAFGAILVGLSVWLVSAMLFNVPSKALSDQVHGSKIVRFIGQVLPPAPPVIARIQSLINPAGFPQVFLGPEPKPGFVEGGATQAEVDQAVAADGLSTVKITGKGCGGELVGSGFVAANGLVVTNAHVVAGITEPLILDRTGVHRAVVVAFDPNLDAAVLRAGGLAGPVLPLQTSLVANGTHSVALGYPGGGPLAAAPAAVIQSYLATGRNIYAEGITTRRVYEIKADIHPGNSGGPLVLPSGEVIGVIFARSQTNDQIGYALTAKSVVPLLERAATSRRAISTGVCAAE